MTPHPLRFRDFELDPGQFELSRAGHRIRLERKPLELLILLAEKRGQLVSREEIIERVWGKDVFFDAERGVNNAIRKIRTALCDDSERPRFVETVLGKGYRFIGPIEDLARPAAEQRPAKESESAQPFPVGLRKRPFQVVLATSALLALALLMWLVIVKRSHSLTPTDTVVLADFTNTTGDPVFDSALRQALAVKLEESPFLNIVSDQKMNTMLQLAGLPTTTPVTLDVARDICMRSGSKAMITGSIAQLGSQYLVTIQSLNCETGNTLARAEREATGKDHVMAALGRAAAELRGKLGESLLTLQRFDRPLEEATTSSIEALQAYTLGWKTLLGKGSAEAVPFFNRAIELDHRFAIAHSALGTAYYDLEELGLATESFKRAFELRDRASERERFYITASYYTLGSGQLKQARTTYELWIEADPRDPIAHGDLGDLYAMMGQYEKAIEETREAIRLDQDLSYAYGNLMAFYVATDNLNDARSTYLQTRARKLDAPYLHLSLYLIEFLENDTAGMAREVDWAGDEPGEQDELLSLQATTEAYYGRLGKSVAISRLAAASAERAGKKEAAGLWLAAQALVQALFGAAGGARETAAAALKLGASRDIEATAAMALAQAGDINQAKALANDLSHRFSSDTFTTFVYVPTIEAQVELSHGKMAQAIEVLNGLGPYELGQPTPASGFVIPIMYPVYVRGDAYLKARQGSAAVAEFQKILNHRGLVANSPVGALAHLGLARAFRLQAAAAQSQNVQELKSQARAGYQDFLELWKSADFGVPVLQHAKAEYAELQ